MSNDLSINQKLSPQNIVLRTGLNQIREWSKQLTYRPGVHTRNYLLAAGFHYTGDGDTARCEHCGLEISNWTTDMVPFTIHSKRSPRCSFVCFVKAPLFPSTTAVRTPSVLNEQQNTSECYSVEPVDSNRLSNILTESDELQQVRRRTFSHWSCPSIPSSKELGDAGFFNCNTKDRVICIYCNLICERWVPYVDDPCDVHKNLSPRCPYVNSVLVRYGPRRIINDNSSLMRVTAVRPSFPSNNISSLSMSGFVRPDVPNNNGGAIQNDLSSSNRSTSIDNSIQADYFKIDTKTVVTCPSCNGSFRNLDSNENLMIDHARRFPDCVYVRQLQGVEMYRQICESNRTQQESEQLTASDANTLSRLVAARLDLPISQALLNRSYSVRIIKQCWEDQLRLKGEDFVTDRDLKVACLILRKQEEQIHGETGVTIPSQRMEELRQQEMNAQAEVIAQIQAVRRSTLHHTNRSNSENVSNSNDGAISTTDTCVVCLVEKKVLAFLPCGHFNTCVPCGHSLHSCPVCRQRKEAVVTIFA